ncbi:MAG TPA: 3',5'-cyclic-nucleotide phosphodiesterase [Thermodesulfovibrionales bacterium]|nr:3',5'-cyclic-nucleotide phosphodiesterase [Thermodesulfovibrionales bacterium]
MKIKVLGCSGAEFPRHNTPGFLLDKEILFDAGSLTNALSEDAQLKLHTIFITHAHLDHIKGIPFLADNLISRDKGHKVTIMSIPPVIKIIRENLFNGNVWPDFTILPDPCNGVLKYTRLKEGKPVSITNYRITPYRVNHSVPATGYLVEDRHKRRFFYSGDTGPTEGTWTKIGNTQIHCLIIEVSFPDKMKDTALLTGHLTAGLLKEEISKIRFMPERIYITHTKPQYSEIIRNELKGLKMKNVSILRDGEIIRV